MLCEKRDDVGAAACVIRAGKRRDARAGGAQYERIETGPRQVEITQPETKPVHADTHKQQRNREMNDDWVEERTEVSEQGLKHVTSVLRSTERRAGAKVDYVVDDEHPRPAPKGSCMPA